MYAHYDIAADHGLQQSLCNVKNHVSFLRRVAVILSRCAHERSDHVYPHCNEKSSIRYDISGKSFTVVVSDVKSRSSPREVGIESIQDYSWDDVLW